MHTCHVPEAHADRAAELARLSFLARKVGMVHGPIHPAMVELASVVAAMAQSPTAPIASEQRTTLQRLTTNYTPWPGACGSVCALFAGLRQLPDAVTGTDLQRT